jgi:preprotein translocase subunit SecG
VSPSALFALTALLATFFLGLALLLHIAFRNADPSLRREILRELTKYVAAAIAALRGKASDPERPATRPDA